MHLLTKFWDSRHVQLAIYTVFDEESESEVKNKQFLRPEGKNKEKRIFKIFEFLKISSLHFSMFFLKSLGPKRFKKLRQACRKNFHLVAPLKNGVVTSYDQECKKVNEY